uniref:Protein kinase domain-containing protein n=2 Tax=Norrisiella sphaerica TaxID=552664 RepID=A0A7S2QTB5_9EUKA|mmetsp:Transcript_355/g.507  ORF Transcript_355/g.507 Transcript_355/m.507 type:complete len:677 (+) Transcript_355:118-2148(+)
MQSAMSENYRRVRGTKELLQGGGGPYSIHRTLGRGATAVAKLATHQRTGEKVAVKVMLHKTLYQMNIAEQYQREIRMHIRLNHPHVCRLFEVIETPISVSCVMELGNDDLFDYIVQRGRLSEDEARKFFQQLIAGLEYCHSRNITHRDIKPENLIITKDGRLLIADFGLAAEMRPDEKLTQGCGSLNYAAPELHKKIPSYDGPEVDVWSAGVVLYVMLCGTLPFDGKPQEIRRLIQKGMYRIPHFLSAKAKDLLCSILIVDPAQRFSIAEIREHPWFRANLPSYLAAPASSQNVSRHNLTSFESVATEVQRKGGYSLETIRKALALGENLLLLPAFGNRKTLRGAAVMFNILETKHNRTILHRKDEIMESKKAEKSPKSATADPKAPPSSHTQMNANSASAKSPLTPSSLAVPASITSPSKVSSNDSLKVVLSPELRIPQEDEPLSIEQRGHIDVNTALSPGSQLQISTPYASFKDAQMSSYDPLVSPKHPAMSTESLPFSPSKREHTSQAPQTAAEFSQGAKRADGESSKGMKSLEKRTNENDLSQKTTYPRRSDEKEKPPSSLQVNINNRSAWKVPFTLSRIQTSMLIEKVYDALQAADCRYVKANEKHPMIHFDKMLPNFLSSASPDYMIGAKVRIRRSLSKSRIVLDFEQVMGDMMPFTQLCSSIALSVAGL